jgi:hypothetical protein
MKSQLQLLEPLSRAARRWRCGWGMRDMHHQLFLSFFLLFVQNWKCV